MIKIKELAEVKKYLARLSNTRWNIAMGASGKIVI
jgi:hypothetical protein